MDRREYYRLLREATATLGLCAQCRRVKRVRGRSLCERCADRQRARDRARSAAKKKGGE